ncbi:MAG: AraC family transcriptional regulator [Prevotella sp.]|nr:AraC family transcriptional regulator [Candidatus Prevotella equi]
MKKKTYRQRIFCYAEGISIAFYAILAIYLFPDIDYKTMVRMEAISIPLSILFPAFLAAYMYLHCFGKKMNDKLMFLLIIPAIVVAVAVNLLCHIVGFEKAAEISRQFASPEGLVEEFNTSVNHLYCFFTYNVFVVLGATYVSLLYAGCFATMYRQGYRFGDITRFFFRGRATSYSRVIAFLYIVELTLMIPPICLGGVFISNHIYLGVFLSVALAITKHLIAFVEFYSDQEKPVTLYELSHLTLFSEEDEDPLQPYLREEIITEEPENKNIPTPAQIKMDKRLEQFRELMEVEQVWRDEELTSASLCEMMNIGKTTLSAMISQQYDTTFRDIINNYRIEAAKHYMQAHPKATQETIAQHCGFRNAQYFNTQFKKVVGETPTMWLTRNGSDSAE